MNKTLEDILAEHRKKSGNIIALLQETQDAIGYIPKEAIAFYSEEMGIAPSRFYGVATFYSQFYLKPRGKNIVTACCGTACHVKGSERILNSVMQELKLKENEDMTEDGRFTVERVNCVGACGIAPVFVINKKVHGKSTAEKVIREIRTLKGNGSGEE